MLTFQHLESIMPLYVRKELEWIMTKTRKVFLIWNIILLVLAMTCLLYYDYEGGLWLKGVTSAWFALLGFVNLIYARKMNCKNFRFACLMELALFLGMAADVLLGIHFMVGTIVFALGHVGYCVAFYALEKFNRRDLYMILPIGTVSLYVLLATPYIQVEDPVMKIILILYAVVISCMLGKAISNLLAKRTPARWLIAIGSTLFWFSDLMLALNLFGDGGHLASFLCLYSYWPGQSILAHSVFHFVNKNCAKKES